MSTRKLGFKTEPDGLTVACPQIYPVDAITGEMIHGVRKCTVSSEYNGLTIMRLEVVLFKEPQTIEEQQEILQRFTDHFNATKPAPIHAKDKIV